MSILPGPLANTFPRMAAALRVAPPALPMIINWTPRSANRKTGDVPTAWIGADREGARKSCAGCPLLDRGCYAHSGAVALGAHSARKAAAGGADRSLRRALRMAARSARMVRVTGIGDIGRCGEPVATAIVNEVSAAGLDVVGYTHHWRESEVAAAWRGTLLASTERIEDADRAVSEGWRATVIVPEGTARTFVTPAGNRAIVCPAQVSGKVTCNDCRLCAGGNRGPIIAFLVHGNEAAKAVLS